MNFTTASIPSNRMDSSYLNSGGHPTTDLTRVAQQPKVVILDTRDMLEKYRTYHLNKFWNDDGELLETIVRQLFELFKEWDTVPVFLEELTQDLIDALNVTNPLPKIALKRGVMELAHAFIKKIENHGLLCQEPYGCYFFYEYQGMQGSKVILRSRFCD